MGQRRLDGSNGYFLHALVGRITQDRDIDGKSITMSLTREGMTVTYFESKGLYRYFDSAKSYKVSLLKS